MTDVRRQAGHHERVFDLIAGYGPDLSTLCRAGLALVAGADGIGVSAGPAGRTPRTLFGSDTTSARLEAAQDDLGEGPCYDAATGEPVRAADLTDAVWSRRWPRFTAAALNAGIRAVYAVPLHAGGVRHHGAVGLYRRTAGDWAGTGHSAATFTAAATELLTLRRHRMSLGDAFTAGRIGDLIGSRDAPEAPLLRWFNQATLRRARLRAGAFGAAHGLPDGEVPLLVLAVHEAMANAVCHGHGRGQLLMWRKDDRLWCEITDHGPGMTGGGVADGGLLLIRRACSSVDVTSDRTGTRLLLGYPLSTSM